MVTSSKVDLDGENLRNEDVSTKGIDEVEDDAMSTSRVSDTT